MLGSDVCRTFQAEGHEVLPVSTDDFDIENAAAALSAVKLFGPELIVHTAAYTDVDGCERDPDRANRVNALGTWNVATAAAECKASIVVISTDFVFDGEKREPYTEFDATHPLGAYGSSKLLGERLAQTACRRTYVVRTSWLYGCQGKCFPKTILTHAQTKPELRVVADQVGSPTFTRDLAEALVDLVKLPLYGVYHVANSGQCSWFELASELLKRAGRTDVTVTPISSTAWQSPTQRPAYSALRGYVRELQGKPPLRHWSEALDDYVKGI